MRIFHSQSSTPASECVCVYMWWYIAQYLFNYVWDIKFLVLHILAKAAYICDTSNHLGFLNTHFSYVSILSNCVFLDDISFVVTHVQIQLTKRAAAAIIVTTINKGPLRRIYDRNCLTPIPFRIDILHTPVFSDSNFFFFLCFFLQVLTVYRAIFQFES